MADRDLVVALFQHTVALVAGVVSLTRKIYQKRVAEEGDTELTPNY